MLTVIARIEALVLLVTSFYLGAGTVALGFLTFLSMSAPAPRLMIVNALVAIATIAALVIAIKLFAKPTTGWMVAGGLFMAAIAALRVAKSLGFNIGA